MDGRNGTAVTTSAAACGERAAQDAAPSCAAGAMAPTRPVAAQEGARLSRVGEEAMGAASLAATLRQITVRIFGRTLTSVDEVLPDIDLPALGARVCVDQMQSGQWVVWVLRKMPDGYERQVTMAGGIDATAAELRTLLFLGRDESAAWIAKREADALWLRAVRLELERGR